MLLIAIRLGCKDDTKMHNMRLVSIGWKDEEKYKSGMKIHLFAMFLFFCPLDIWMGVMILLYVCMSKGFCVCCAVCLSFCEFTLTILLDHALACEQCVYCVKEGRKVIQITTRYTILEMYVSKEVE